MIRIKRKPLKNWYWYGKSIPFGYIIIHFALDAKWYHILEGITHELYHFLGGNRHIYLSAKVES